MKIQCEIIRDLIPLMEDEVCSEQSKKAVLEHIKKCEECKRIYENSKIHPEFVLNSNENKEEEVIKNGFRKIKRKWRASILIILLIVPVVVLSWGQAWGNGIAFTNLDDIYRCIQYLNYIKKGEYDRAAEKAEFLNNEQLKDTFIEKLQEYERLGISLCNIVYDSAYYNDEDGIWTICVAFKEVYPDGSQQRIVAHMNGETMEVGVFEYFVNKIGRDDYIDVILTFDGKEQTLSYQDYGITFELNEGEKAVIQRITTSDIDIKGVTNITYGTQGSILDGPYAQEVFETSIPGKYSVITYDDKIMKFLSDEEIDVEIYRYSK